MAGRKGLKRLALAALCLSSTQCNAIFGLGDRAGVAVEGGADGSGAEGGTSGDIGGGDGGGGCELHTYYADGEPDGYGDPSSPFEACSQPDGYVEDNTDCDDTKAEAHPGAEEICGNCIDESCSGGDSPCDATATLSFDPASPTQGETVSVVLQSGYPHACIIVEIDTLSGSEQLDDPVTVTGPPWIWTYETVLSESGTHTFLVVVNAFAPCANGPAPVICAALEVGAE